MSMGLNTTSDICGIDSTLSGSMYAYALDPWALPTAIKSVHIADVKRHRFQFNRCAIVRRCGRANSYPDFFAKYPGR